MCACVSVLGGVCGQTLWHSSAQASHAPLGPPALEPCAGQQVRHCRHRWLLNWGPVTRYVHLGLPAVICVNNKTQHTGQRTFIPTPHHRTRRGPSRAPMLCQLWHSPAPLVQERAGKQTGGTSSACTIPNCQQNLFKFMTESPASPTWPASKTYTEHTSCVLLHLDGLTPS